MVFSLFVSLFGSLLLCSAIPTVLSLCMDHLFSTSLSLPFLFARYKSAIGLSACSSCPPFYRTLSEGCVAYEECVCVSGFEPIMDPTTHTPTDCVCPLGSQLSDAVTMVCTPCGVGSYRSNLTTPLCTTCPDPSRTPTEGAASRLDCLCADGYYRYEVSGWVFMWVGRVV